MRIILCFSLCFAGSLAQNWHELNGVEYYYDVSAYGTHDGAIQECKGLGGTLVIIKSEEVDKFVMGIPKAGTLKSF